MLNNLKRALLFYLLDCKSNFTFRKYYNHIQESQWLSREDILELQFNKLKHLIEHCYQNVPFYKIIFYEMGITPQQIQDFQDFEKLPVITKRQIMEVGNSLKAQNYPQDIFVHKSTGGSTGEPLNFYRDNVSMAYNFSHVLRNYTWAGLTLGEKHVFLWGAHYDLKAQQKLQNRLINFCLNQEWLDAFAMNEENMMNYYLRIKSSQPKLLTGYATALFNLARYIREASVDPIDPLAVVSTAELLLPEHRKLIEEVFSCKMYDRLGCREVGNTAHECEAHEGLHINAEHVYMEFTQNGKSVKSGKEGEILYTSLDNFVYPLLRYKVGDIGIPIDKTCACGRGLPMMKVACGRISDMLVACDGTKVHGEFFSHLFYGIDYIKQFQVIQEEDRSINIYLNLSSNRSSLLDGHKKQIIGMVEKVFGENIILNFYVVDEIPRTNSGKFRFTINKMEIQ